MNYSMDDYLAKLNVEGKRNVWASHGPKMDFILDKVVKYLPPNAKVCEVGVGAGQLLDRLYDLNMDCVGMDISDYLIKFHKNRVSKENRKIQFICANIVDTIVEYNTFDAIFCIDILEHITEEEYLESLKNIHIMLKKGGIFVVSVPYMENLDPKMTKCPQCGCEFHVVGHKQVFDLEKMNKSISPYFKLKEIGKIQLDSFNNLPFYKRNYSLIGCVKAIKNKFVTKKSKIEQPDIKPGDTGYFIAEKV